MGLALTQAEPGAVRSLMYVALGPSKALQDYDANARRGHNVRNTGAKTPKVGRLACPGHGHIGWQRHRGRITSQKSRWH